MSGSFQAALYLLQPLKHDWQSRLLKIKLMQTSQNWIQKVLDINKIYYSIFIGVACIIIGIIFNSLFVTEVTYSQWYDGIMTRSQIQDTVAYLKKWEIGVALLNVLFVFIKMAGVAMCLYLGVFLFASQNTSFTTFFNITLKGEIVFIVYSIVRIFWYRFVHMPESIEALQVLPLSLMNFFDPAVIEPWLIYPLSTLNLFEVFYVFTLSGLMMTAMAIKFKKALELVFVSYGAGLLLLMIVQMFVILNR